MLALSKLLAEYVSTEFIAAAKQDSQSAFRLFFTGVPDRYLDEVFLILQAPETGLRIAEDSLFKDVYIFQVDDSSFIPASLGRACKGSESAYINLRNHPSIRHCVVLSSRPPRIQSLGSAVRPLGVTGRIRSFEDWLNSSLFQHIWSTTFRACAGIIDKDRLRKAVEFSLEKAWNADQVLQTEARNECWSFIERLLEVASCQSFTLDDIAIALGLLRCPDEDFGKPQHLETIDQVLDYFYETGLRSGFSQLKKKGTHVSELEELEQLLAETGIYDTTELENNPIRTFASIASRNEQQALWWSVLNTRNWLALLDFGEPTQIGDIRYEIRGRLIQNAFSSPIVVRDCVEIFVNPPEDGHPIEITVERSNGGSAPLTKLGSFNSQLGSNQTFVDSDIPEHQQHLKYRLSASGYQQTDLKVIVLDYYGPGVVVDSLGISKHGLFRKKKNADQRNEPQMNSELHFGSLGYHKLDLYYAARLLGPTDFVGNEDDPVNYTVSTPEAGHAIVELEIDQESGYRFDLPGTEHGLQYNFQITADDSPPLGMPSEFDRLVFLNVASNKNRSISVQTEVRPSRLVNLEGYLLSNSSSYRPVLFGPDAMSFIGDPWSRHYVSSDFELPHELVPEDWSERIPEGFLSSRSAVVELIRAKNQEQIDCFASYQLHDDEDGDLSRAIKGLVSEYKDWLQDDPSAIWCDLIAITEKQPHADILESRPTVILLTPLHPIRLAWQVNAQTELRNALFKNHPCPIASELTPFHFPDCVSLPCATATGRHEDNEFIALQSTNSYWSVLWSLSDLRRLHGESDSRVILRTLDLSVDGLYKGFKPPQVKRAINEVLRLKPAVSELSLTVAGRAQDTESFNNGLLEWVSENLGDTSDSNQWRSVGGLTLSVMDRRAKESYPEQSALASASDLSHGALTWYSADGDPAPSHLGIITQLGSATENKATTELRSGTDVTALIKRRIRQLEPANKSFLVESIIARDHANEYSDDLAAQLNSAVNVLERKCLGGAEGLSFAPDTNLLETVVANASFTAVSSSNIDAACFFEVGPQAYLWEYELPSFGKSIGGAEGYFLLARQSEAMIASIKSGLKFFDQEADFSDQMISELLEEISKRGMPTLKKLSSGGKSALGELGLLAALKLFQFEVGNRESGIIPITNAEQGISLLIPIDPFEEQISALRKSLDGRAGERPDVLVVWVSIDSLGIPTSLRLTPVEVKSRSDGLSPSERGRYLTQAKYFSNFLVNLKEAGDDSPIWGLAWRDLICRMVDYGCRIYSQGGLFGDNLNWSDIHQKIVHAITSNECEIEIDLAGRLVVVDSSANSNIYDDNSDGFKETFVLAKTDALKMLQCEAPEWLDRISNEINFWGILPEGLEPPETENEIESAPIVLDSTETTPPNASETTQTNSYAASENLDNSEPNREQEGISFTVGSTIQDFNPEDLKYQPGNTNLTQMNVGVVGDLGTGKTQLIKALITQLCRSASSNLGKQPNVLIFDYKRDYSDPDFIAAVGATVVDPFNIPLNIFDTSNSTTPSIAWLNRVRFFNDVLRKIFANVGPVQQANVKEAARSAYESASAFGRNDPTLKEVFDAYKERVGTKIDSPYSIMDNLVDGLHFTADHEAVIPFSDFLNGVVVINLSAAGADDQTKNMLVAIFLNLFYEHMLTIEKKPTMGPDRDRRFVDTMLLVDEADNIMKYEFPVLRQILLQGREFGVGVLLASQYLSHFKTTNENYAEPLGSWFIHKVPNIRPRELDSLGLSTAGNEVTNKIKELGKHECLYKSWGVDGKFMRGTPFYELCDPTEEN